jgi:hypothetical protein
MALAWPRGENDLSAHAIWLAGVHAARGTTGSGSPAG